VAIRVRHNHEVACMRRTEEQVTCALGDASSERFRRVAGGLRDRRRSHAAG